MATPPNDPANKPEASGPKRRPTEPFAPGSGLISPTEATTGSPDLSSEPRRGIALPMPCSLMEWIAAIWTSRVGADSASAISRSSSPFAAGS